MIIVAREIYLWRGDLSPLGCAATAKEGLLRSPAGINPLATDKSPSPQIGPFATRAVSF
ncbi:protein of unknown function [Pseudomonas mediterranea]